MPDRRACQVRRQGDDPVVPDPQRPALTTATRNCLRRPFRCPLRSRAAVIDPFLAKPGGTGRPVEGENPRRRGEFASAPRPDLILVDLNLPRKAGHEVLAEVKSDADLQRFPVVMLTTSDAGEDRLRSYDLHANPYVTKPVDFDRFLDVVRQIGEFFVTVVRLPGP